MVRWFSAATKKLYEWFCLSVHPLNASILVWHTCASALSGWVLYRQLELTKLTRPDLHHVVGLFILRDVRPSICLSVSIRHTFLTMFSSSYHHEIFRSYYQWQKWRPCKRSRSKVKVTEVNTHGSHFRTLTPVWIYIWWWNDTYSLMLLRRGALLCFKVICQISRSHG